MSKAKKNGDASAKLSGKATPPYKHCILDGNESNMMREVFATRPWWSPADKPQSNNLWWGSNGQKIPSWPEKGPSTSRRVVNRVQGNTEICTKTGLAGNLAAIAQGTKQQLPWVPYTFLMTAGKSTPPREITQLQQAMKKLEPTQGEVWMVKPGSMNRGRGIEIFNSEKDIVSHLQKQRSGTQWVIQKYIERPLLVQGRKFDIRAFVLVAPDKKVYMFKEGYIRTTCFEYKLENLQDKFIHLTNDAYQKTHEDFGKFEEANKLSYPQFEEAVKGAVNMQDGVVPQLKACLTAVFGHVISKMNPSGINYCFELFGIDFMLDEQGQAYLIEMNTSPALFRKGAYLQDMLPRMIEEVVQKSVDPYFPPPDGTSLPDPLDGFLQIVP